MKERTDNPKRVFHFLEARRRSPGQRLARKRCTSGDKKTLNPKPHGSVMHEGFCEGFEIRAGSGQIPRE